MVPWIKVFSLNLLTSLFKTKELDINSAISAAYVYNGAVIGVLFEQGVKRDRGSIVQIISTTGEKDHDLQ